MKVKHEQFSWYWRKKKKKKRLDTKILNSNIKVAFNNDLRIRTVDIKN